MKGVNFVRLNAAQLEEAVAYWLNETQLRDNASVRVTKVEWEGGLGTFLCKLEEPGPGPNAIVPT